MSKIKFVIEYSVCNLETIAIFLKHNIRLHSIVLYYDKQDHMDITEVAENSLNYFYQKTGKR